MQCSISLRQLSILPAQNSYISFILQILFTVNLNALKFSDNIFTIGSNLFNFLAVSECCPVMNLIYLPYIFCNGFNWTSFFTFSSKLTTNSPLLSTLIMYVLANTSLAGISTLTDIGMLNVLNSSAFSFSSSLSDFTSSRCLATLSANMMNLDLPLRHYFSFN